MERSPQATGWHGMRFNIGRFDPNNQEYVESPEIEERKDRCCTQENCGCGCYVATVDVDRLDQQ